MQELGINARTTALLEHAYSGIVDFRHDLHKGDSVSVVIGPPRKAAHQFSRAGAPLAVRLQHGTAYHDLFLHRGLQGKPFYYTRRGTVMTSTFDRYPIVYTRVSSGFALGRLDPVTSSLAEPRWG